MGLVKFDLKKQLTTLTVIKKFFLFCYYYDTGLIYLRGLA